MSRENNYKKEYTQIEDFGIIGRTKGGYTKHFEFGRYDNDPPVYEIRTYGPDGRRLTRPGMTPEEIENLKEILANLN